MSANAYSEAPATVDLKVVLLGRHYVGKTALMERFLHERFLSEDGYQTTIGAAYGSKRLPIKPTVSRGAGSIVLGVWDTAGQEHYKSLARIYYRGAGAAIVCYDITDPDSLAKAHVWAGELAASEPRCRLYVCGCKLDLPATDPDARRVSASAVREFATEVGAAAAVETSSKTGENVAELFATIAEDFVRAGGGVAIASASASASPSGAAASGAASGATPVRLRQQNEPRSGAGQGKQCVC